MSEFSQPVPWDDDPHAPADQPREIEVDGFNLTEGAPGQWSVNEAFDSHATDNPDTGPELPDPAAEEIPDPFYEIEDQLQQDISAITHQGYLEDSFTFCGHSFSVRAPLNPKDDLAIGPAIQDYRGTLKEPEAWVWGHVSLALTSFDGDSNFCPPIGPDKLGFAQARLNWATEAFYYPTAEYLFSRFQALQGRVVAATRAVQDLSERSQPTFSPSAGFSTGPGTSSGSTG